MEYAVELLHSGWRSSPTGVIVPMDEVALTALTGNGSCRSGEAAFCSMWMHAAGPSKSSDDSSGRRCFGRRRSKRWCRYDWARIAGDSQFRELRLPERALHIRPTLRDDAAVRQRSAGVRGGQSDIETPRQMVLREKVLKSGKTKVSKAYRASPDHLYCVCAGGELERSACRRRWTTGEQGGSGASVVVGEGCPGPRCAEGAAEWVV